MEEISLESVAERMYELRPDEAYSVDEILANIRSYNSYGRRYAPGEVCLVRDTPVTDMLMVLRGVVHVMMKTDMGEDILIRSVTPGGYIGVTALYDYMPVHPMDAVAFDEAEIAFFNIELVGKSRTDPRSIPLFNYLGRRICEIGRQATEKVVILGGMNITERLRRYLAFRMSRDNTNVINIPGTEDDLAKYLCVNKCAMSRVFSKLKREGKLIYRRNEITVLSKDW